MSGGHWDYQGYQMREALDMIATDVEVVRRFPALARVIAALRDTLGDVDHALDWDLSGDTCIQDDPQFEQDWIARLAACVTGDWIAQP